MGPRSARGCAVWFAFVIGRSCIGARAVTAPCRNKTSWPFAADSIWNVAVGSDAHYVPANISLDLTIAHGVMGDPEYFLATAASDPLVPFYEPQSWAPIRCNGTKPHHAPAPTSLQLPPDFIVPDCSGKDTPNNAAAFLLPDGHTLVQTNPVCRSVPGGPVYGYTTPGEDQGQFEDIHGPGITGGHGGSGLSSLGGSIMPGELLPDSPPIRHALKLELFAFMYYYRNSSSGQCYRWPAVQCDNYAGSGPLAYNGTNPAVMPGSLLALRPADFHSLNSSLTTVPGRRIAAALLDYGGYLVSDAAWDVRQICVQAGVPGEFLAAYGYNFTTAHDPPHGPSWPFWADIATIFSELFVVDNNGPNSIGGGGTPRQPPPPPFCD